MKPHRGDGRASAKFLRRGKAKGGEEVRVSPEEVEEFVEFLRPGKMALEIQERFAPRSAERRALTVIERHAPEIRDQATLIRVLRAFVDLPAYVKAGPDLRFQLRAARRGAGIAASDLAAALGLTKSQESALEDGEEGVLWSIRDPEAAGGVLVRLACVLAKGRQWVERFIDDAEMLFGYTGGAWYHPIDGSARGITGLATTMTVDFHALRRVVRRAYRSPAASRPRTPRR
jgi:hypothetical protein